jgi:4-amino-4-deoxy-L-arabinose transferase-like glycosyltransferase
VSSALLRGRYQAALALIVATGTALRLVDLGKVPGPFNDEVLAGLDSHAVLSTGLHYNGTPLGLLGYIVPILDGRLFLGFAGIFSIYGLRMIAVAFGTGTIIFVYLVGKELFNPFVGILGAVAFAVMPWAIYFDRVFIPASEYVFFTLLAQWFLITGLRRQSAARVLLCGVACVVTIYIYPTAIVSTPLFAFATLVSHRVDLKTFSVARLAWIGIVPLALLGPYVGSHIFSNSGPQGQNAIIASRLLWGHGQSVPHDVTLFLRDWASYFTPSYLAFHGDPNPAQSIRSLGEVGYVITAIAIVGILTCAIERSRPGKLLLAWLILAPVGDALTYQNAYASSVVGATGELPWALLAGVGAYSIWRLARVNLGRVVAAFACAILLLGIALQTVAFGRSYFGPYESRYSYEFVEATAFKRIGTTLAANHVTKVPITMHAGYLRDAMLDYFTNYRVDVRSWYPTCQLLPRDVVLYTVSPRIFVIREDTSYLDDPACVSQQTDIIALDRRELASAGWSLSTLALYSNGPSGGYETAILFGTRTSRFVIGAH